MLRRRFVRVIEKTLGLFPAYDEVGRLVNVVLAEQKKNAELREVRDGHETILDAIETQVDDPELAERMYVHEDLGPVYLSVRSRLQHIEAQKKTIEKMRIYLERAARELKGDFAEDAKKEGLI
jgi:hypothetical protein